MGRFAAALRSFSLRWHSAHFAVAVLRRKHWVHHCRARQRQYSVYLGIFLLPLPGQTLPGIGDEQDPRQLLRDGVRV